MRSQYFDTPTAAVAVNFKAGSASLSRAIISAHHPAIDTLLTTPHGAGNGTAYPPGVSADTLRTQGLCPKLTTPKDRPVTLIPVRDPVDKFRSACVEAGVADVDAKLTLLEDSSDQRDVHFWPQARLLAGNTIRLYRFPEHLEDLAIEAGLDLPLPVIDGGNDPAAKPTLTPTQLARVQTLYAADIALFESIESAGQRYTLPAPPMPPQVTRHPALIALAAAYKSGITLPFGEGSITLACGDRDRALFTSALALYREAENLQPTEQHQAGFRNSMVTIADINGVTHPLSITQARQLLVAYGVTYQTLWAAAAQANS